MYQFNSVTEGGRELLEAQTLFGVFQRSDRHVHSYYLATRPEGIYVLHCFQKQTQKTRQQDLDLAQQRFKSIQVKP